MGLLSALNNQQLAAARHYKGPALVVAGAGTGKTHLITHRIAHLIEQKGVKPAEILGLTFTEKAAKEMETRVSELLKKYILDVKITTFNAFGYEVVKRFAYELGMNPSLALLSDSQQLIFLRDHLEELKLHYYAPVTNPEGLLSDLAAYFSKLRGELITPKQYKKFARVLQKAATTPDKRVEAKRHLELATAFELYQQLKRRQNVIDFDDQVNLVVELLQSHPNVRQKLALESKFILVDEFQDTNPAQSALVDLLAGQSRNLMVVGDDDQSIYRFRGAAIVNILQFLDRYPQAQQFTLTKNYRSSQPILDSAYSLIQHNNPDRLEAKYHINKQLQGISSGHKPGLETFMTYDEEAQFIARDIKARLKGGQAAGEIAVLIRKNTQANILARYLEAENVSYHIVGQSEDMYRQPEIKTLLNFLRVLSDPKDSTSLYHLMSSQIYNFDPRWLREFVAEAKRTHQPLETVLGTGTGGKLAAKEEARLSSFLEELTGFRQELNQLSVGQLSYRFLLETGYLHKLVRAAKNDPSLDQKIANLNQFFKSLREFEGISQDTSAVGYIEALPTLLGSGERLVIEDLPELFGQKVLILTVHKAKGLEFESVYLFDLTQDSFPARARSSSLDIPDELTRSSSVLSGNPHLLEERRLMYVALTRAKQDLTLTSSLDHGGRQAKRPSIFIEEALGEHPALTKLKTTAGRTDQIELFRVKNAKLPVQQFELPPTILRDNQLWLTARQLEDYLTCPAEFYLRHIISPPQPLNFALEYGNLMHGLIQFYNRARIEGVRMPLPKLLEYIDANWPKETFLSLAHKERSLKQAKASLRRFWTREEKAPRHPVYIERSFEFDLPSAKAKIRGRYDAVYSGESTEIRDYKTGAIGVDSQTKADQRAKASFQLGVYALAWQEINAQIPDALSLDFIDSGYVGKATKTPRQLQSLETKITKAAEGIWASDFSPAKSHLFCTHPEYGF